MSNALYVPPGPHDSMTVGTVVLTPLLSENVDELRCAVCLWGIGAGPRASAVEQADTHSRVVHGAAAPAL